MNELIQIATFGDDEEANKAMAELRKINPSYHWCPEWDYLAICDQDFEFKYCVCEMPTIENS